MVGSKIIQKKKKKQQPIINVVVTIKEKEGAVTMNEHTKRFSSTSNVLFLNLDDLVICTYIFYALLYTVQFQN